MKALITLSIVVLFGSIVFAQSCINLSAPRDTVVIDSTNHQRILLGYCSREAFKDTSFSWWFNSVYDMYEIDSATAQNSKDKLDSVKITVVMGTWCSDSHREVPKFLRIMDYLKFPENKISILTVGRNLKGMADETADMNIKSVPTFIFYKNGSEIGRIQESPKESLEKDMLKILNG